MEQASASLGGGGWRSRAPLLAAVLPALTLILGLRSRLRVDCSGGGGYVPLPLQQMLVWEHLELVLDLREFRVVLKKDIEGFNNYAWLKLYQPVKY